MTWLRERSLTLTFMAAFITIWLGQIWSGHIEFNQELADKGQPLLSLWQYMASGHMWEATFENWESEFLQMAAFVVLTAFCCPGAAPALPGGPAPSRKVTPTPGGFGPSLTRPGRSDAGDGFSGSTSTHSAWRSFCSFWCRSPDIPSAVGAPIRLNS